MVVHTCNPGTQEAEAGRMKIQSQARLHTPSFKKVKILKAKPKQTKQTHIGGNKGQKANSVWRCLRRETRAYCLLLLKLADSVCAMERPFWSKVRS